MLRLVKIAFIFIFIEVLYTPLMFAQNSNINVLYINSYHNGFYWSDGITEGIRTTLEKHPGIEIQIEYLDAKRHPEYSSDPICLNYFSQKYKSETIDYIITSDNDALDFVLNNRTNQIFDKKPIVACGISNVDDYTQYDNIYLVKEITTYEETFEIIQKLFPKFEKLVFITDNLKSGQIYVSQVSEIFKEKYSNLQLEFITCIDINTLAETIQKYTFPTVIFYATTNQDCNRQPVNEYDIAEIISKNARAPLFSGHYSTTTRGFIGGCMTTGSQNGKIASSIIIDLINKKKDLQVKVIVPEVISIFNFESLTANKIKLNQLPHDAIILNVPESFWVKNKKILIIGGIIIIQLLTVIGLLYRSILQQKKYEKKILIAMNQANEANRIKSIFLENISHEIRTPLNSIVGFSGILMESIQTEKHFNYIKMINESALSLTEMINSIFNFSLLSSYKAEKQLSTFKVATLLDDVTNSADLQIILSRKHLVLICDYDPEHTELEIVSDKTKLFQVLKHLLMNALKFTLNGTITVNYRLIDKQKIHFKIIDTGIGISQHELEFIFDPFRQADERTINTNRGAGLGLSISKSVIELLSGVIWLESIPKKGTTVNFIIPVKY